MCAPTTQSEVSRCQAFAAIRGPPFGNVNIWSQKSSELCGYVSAVRSLKYALVATQDAKTVNNNYQKVVKRASGEANTWHPRI